MWSIQPLVQRSAEVRVRGDLADATLPACHLAPCADISAEVAKRLDQLGPDARMAVLPQGPLTIPYLA